MGFFNNKWVERCNSRNVRAIKSMLWSLELASGLKVNFHKSFLGAIGVEDRVLERYASILNCKLTSIPFTYLGVPIGVDPSKVDTWKPILCKVSTRLNSLKHITLSIAGKVCLINSVMSSLSLFYLSLFKIPSRVGSKLTKFAKVFSLGGM